MRPGNPASMVSWALAFTPPSSARVENLSRSCRCARWSREKFDAIAETCSSRIILRARTFFASSLTAGPVRRPQRPSGHIRLERCPAVPQFRSGRRIQRVKHSRCAGAGWCGRLAGRHREHDIVHDEWCRRRSQRPGRPSGRQRRLVARVDLEGDNRDAWPGTIGMAGAVKR